MATQWSLDYCLTCDRQTSGEAYCSQNCRLADLETSSVSSSASSCPTSPMYPYTYSSTTHTTHTTHTTSASSHSTNSGFYLPPAFDFAAYRHSRTTSATPSSSVSTLGRQPPSSRPASLCLPTMSTSPYAIRSLHGRAASSPRLLSPSSSQASLSSLQSTGHVEGISRQARDELREYTNSFDQVRDLRRRLASS